MPEIIAALSNLFAPGIGDPLVRGRALAFGILASAMAGLLIGLLAYWKITRDLERNTVAASLGLLPVLGGLVGLSRCGHPEWAAAILALLLLAFCVWDIATYGLASTGGGTLTLPILMAAFGAGPVAGAAAAAAAITAVWIVALGEKAGWAAIETRRHRDHWTFHAPALTVLLGLTAVLVVFWSAYNEFFMPR